MASIVHVTQFTTDSDSSTASFLCLPLLLPLLLPAVELSSESPMVSLNSVLSDNVIAYKTIKGNYDTLGWYYMYMYLEKTLCINYNNYYINYQI